jgi:thioredoxin reductase (NADPH)
VVHERLDRLDGHGGIVERVRTSDGVLDAEAVFVASGAEPRSRLAASIGVTLARGGWIAVDTEQKTDVAGCFAAGDVTSLHSHQVAAAVHEGTQAAAAANHHLYPEELRAP